MFAVSADMVNFALIRCCPVNMSEDKASNVRKLHANVSWSHSPPLSATTESDVLGDGISGSAMALPPPKPATSAIRPDVKVKTAKGRPRNSLLVSKSDTTNCKMKQMEEVADDQSQKLRDILVHLYFWLFSTSVSQCYLLH